MFSKNSYGPVHTMRPASLDQLNISMKNYKAENAIHACDIWRQ